MRSVKEIEADIEFVKEDIEQLRKLGATTYVAMSDLLELKCELAAAKRNEGAE